MALYTRMFRAILNISWRTHPTNRTHIELISEILLWIPCCGRTSIGRSMRSFIEQLCDDSGCLLQDLPNASKTGMDGEKESRIFEWTRSNNKIKTRKKINIGLRFSEKTYCVEAFKAIKLLRWYDGNHDLGKPVCDGTPSISHSPKHSFLMMVGKRDFFGFLWLECLFIYILPCKLSRRWYAFRLAYYLPLI